MSANLIHIHAPAPYERARKIGKCHHCKRRTIHIVMFYEWYSPSWICLQCGESDWQSASKVKATQQARIRKAKEGLAAWLSTPQAGRPERDAQKPKP